MREERNRQQRCHGASQRPKGRLGAPIAAWLLLLAATVVQEARADDGVPPLTLEAAVAYALHHSPLLAARRHGVSAAEATVVEAWSGHLPRLALGASYRISSRDTMTALGLPLTPLADVPTQTPSWQHLNGAILAEVPIYLGGRVVAATGVARAEVEQADVGVRDVERNLTFEVTRTFAKLVELERDIHAVQQSVDALSESRRNTAEKVAVEKVARVDLLKVDTRLAGVRATLISLTNARLIEAGRLNVLLGRAVDLSVVVPSELPRAVVKVPRQPVTARLAENTQVQLAQARLTAARHTVTVARSALLPSISLSANLFMQSGDPASASAYKLGAVGGLVLSVPLFDLSLVYRLKAASSREGERRAELEQVRLETQERTRTAGLQVDDAEARMDATEAAIALAEEALRIEQEKQGLGRDTIENLLDAQAALLASQATYYRALADHTTAVAALARETGVAVRQPGS